MANISAFSFGDVVSRFDIGSFIGDEFWSGPVAPFIHDLTKFHVFVVELFKFRLSMWFLVMFAWLH